MKLTCLAFSVGLASANLRAYKQASARNTQEVFQSRIVGGTEAAPGEFPFFVLWSNSQCGASLIHEDVIISAAHCGGITDNSVLVGAHQEQSTIGGAEFRTITDRRLHPEYDSVTKHNDFLVMKLDSPVFSLASVALNPNPASPVSNELLTVIGFGATSEGGGSPSTLMKVNVNYVDPATCSSNYGETISETFELCAGQPEGGKDSCQGDSGGPILDSNGVQVGVVSYGIGCGRPGFPGVYSRISGSIDWINQQICELSANPPASCLGGTDPTPSATSVSTPAPSPFTFPISTPAPTSTIDGTPTLTASPTGAWAHGGTSPPSATSAPFSFSSVSPQPFESSTNIPTATAPVTSSTVIPQPETLTPTATLAPVFSSGGGSTTSTPTATMAPVFSPTFVTISPTATGHSSDAFWVSARQFACDGFPCPTNPSKVQYCHVRNNGRKKTFCIAGEDAAIVLGQNSGDYCGKCA